MNPSLLPVQSRIVDIAQPRPLWRIYAGMLLHRHGKPANDDNAVVIYRQRGVQARASEVAAYRQLCGECPPGRMPPIYPHVLATPLQLNLLDSDDFPHSLPGLVHLGQRVEWHRPLASDDFIDIECRMNPAEEHERGVVYRLDTDVRRDGELAWREEISFLKPDPEKRARPARRSRDDASHFAPLLHMQFPDDAGRRYARVSGDWNPIHLWQFTSKRFGFKRPIAHGMFTLARCLAVLEARGIDLIGKRIDAQFRAPVMLPAFTNFSLSDRRPDGHFALTDSKKGRILLEGQVTALTSEQ